MKFKQLKQIIEERTGLEVVLEYSYENYDSARIFLPEGGFITVGLEPRKRNIPPFLYFNSKITGLRLPSQNPRNGKYNYFLEGQEFELKRLLIELKEVI